MSKQEVPLSAGELVPEYMEALVSSEEAIVFLGKANIRVMIRRWRQKAESLVTTVKEITEISDLLGDLSVSELGTLRARYDNPSIPVIHIMRSRNNRTMPLDVGSLCRKQDSTTLSRCGWCKYCSGFCSDFGVKMDGYCKIKQAAGGGAYNLIPIESIERCRQLMARLNGDPGSDEYCLAELHLRQMERDHPGIAQLAARKKLPGVLMAERPFDHLCFLADVRPDELQNLQLAITEKLMATARTKKEVDQRIQRLLRLETRAADKPLIPGLRPPGHFKVGDRVVCGIGDMLPDQKWCTGTVINGPNQDGDLVNVFVDEPVSTSREYGGHVLYFCTENPEIISEGDYAYLLQYPKFARAWVDSVHERLRPAAGKEHFLFELTEEALRRGLAPLE